jgi:hypothetical protein
MILEYEEEVHGVYALFDSGSGKTVLPFQVADKLGLRRHLKRGRAVTGAAGQRFPTWRSKTSIKAQVGTYVNGDPNFFGPQFDVNPFFVKPKWRLFGPNSNEASSSLLGRNDYLEVFKTTESGNILTLEWEELDG